jgi:hypothetical protein
MNKIKTKALSLSSLILLTTSLSASADPSSNFAPSAPPLESVEVGSRPLTPEQLAFLEDQGFAGYQEEENNDAGFERYPNLKQALSSYQRTGIGYGFNSDFSNHYLNTVSAYGDTVEFEDGSWWKISSNDNYKALSWRPGDTLVITPNRGWFSSYHYCITNRNTGSSIKANLNVGPIAFGPYTHWINTVDQSTGHLFIENGTCWCVSNKDAYIFREWAPSDTIIVGLNDSWFSSYDHILINVNMNTYIRAKQY